MISRARHKHTPLCVCGCHQYHHRNTRNTTVCVMSIQRHRWCDDYATTRAPQISNARGDEKCWLQTARTSRSISMLSIICSVSVYSVRNPAIGLWRGGGRGWALCRMRCTKSGKGRDGAGGKAHLYRFAPVLGDVDNVKSVLSHVEALHISNVDTSQVSNAKRLNVGILMCRLCGVDPFGDGICVFALAGHSFDSRFLRLGSI